MSLICRINGISVVLINIKIKTPIRYRKRVVFECKIFKLDTFSAACSFNTDFVFCQEARTFILKTNFKAFAFMINFYLIECSILGVSLIVMLLV